MISDYTKKVKLWVRDNQADLYTATVIIFVGMISFGLGRLSVLWQEKPEVRFEDTTFSGGKEQKIGSLPRAPVSVNAPASVAGKAYVASKSGNVYHLPSCPGALKMREENKIWFASKEEARKKGYHPAGNCPGL